MANASAKRVAAQNELAIRNLHIGMLVSTTLSVLFRLFSRRQSLSSIFYILMHILAFVPTFFLYSFLVRVGTSRRNRSGALVSPGDDLNQAGLTEWAWDILYISWACQVGSSLLGDWVWWLYLIIPVYAGYKIWSSIISPMLLGRSSRADAAQSESEPVSKRREKMQKRHEKGDPRVRAVPTKR